MPKRKTYRVDAGRENFYENALLLQESWLREKLAENLRATDDSKTPNGCGRNKKSETSASTAETPIQFQSEPDAQTAAEKIIGKFVLGRAEARSIIAQTKAIEAQENLDRYKREKLFVKHRIKDAKTGAEREVSLRDVEPRKHYYLLDSILEKALESKEQKNLRDVGASSRAKKRKRNLTQNFNDAQNRASRLENQKTRMLEKYSAAPEEIQPIFTPKEIAALDIRAARTIDKARSESARKNCERCRERQPRRKNSRFARRGGEKDSNSRSRFNANLGIENCLKRTIR